MVTLRHKTCGLMLTQTKMHVHRCMMVALGKIGPGWATMSWQHHPCHSELIQYDCLWACKATNVIVVTKHVSCTHAYRRWRRHSVTSSSPCYIRVLSIVHEQPYCVEVHLFQLCQGKGNKPCLSTLRRTHNSQTIQTCAPMMLGNGTDCLV